MKNLKNKKGFSIPEVIIAITIVILIIVTATNLLVSSTRSNRSNINKIIAHNLAQEALEGLRNIRDSYWLHNLYWRGDEDKLFEGNFTADGNYIIEREFVDFDQAKCKSFEPSYLNNITTVNQNAPWKLEKINNTDSFKSVLFESKKSTGDITYYTHNSNDSDNASIFKRWIEIETIPYQNSSSDVSSDELKIIATAVVEWQEQSRVHSFEIPTILTDWKAGPL